MTQTHLVSIDFGSAYTKVAISTDGDGTSELIRDVPLALQDPSFCIPSVVARVKRSGGTKWVVGKNALAQRPGNGVKIYQHLKPRLLSDKPADEAAKDGFEPEGIELSEYQEAGVVFFQEVREALCKMRLPAPMSKCRVRICIPHLGRIPKPREE